MEWPPDLNASTTSVDWRATPAILAPVSGSVVDPESTVSVAAQGYHVEEHRPSFDEITWSSSLDGYVGQGAQLVATLSPGDHTITATTHGVSTDINLTVAAA